MKLNSINYKKTKHSWWTTSTTSTTSTNYTNYTNYTNNLNSLNYITLTPCESVEFLNWRLEVPPSLSTIPCSKD